MNKGELLIKLKVKEVIVKIIKQGIINLEGINLSAIQPIEIAAKGLKY